MNPIKKKLADFLTDVIGQDMDAMDAESPCARSLKRLDRDALLEKDIQLICNELSTLETGKILRLAVKRTSSDTEDAGRYREEMKSMASEVVKRVENEHGSLNLPPECRDFLINLL